MQYAHRPPSLFTLTHARAHTHIRHALLEQQLSEKRTRNIQAKEKALKLELDQKREREKRIMSEAQDMRLQQRHQQLEARSDCVDMRMCVSLSASPCANVCVCARECVCACVCVCVCACARAYVRACRSSSRPKQGWQSKRALRTLVASPALGSDALYDPLCGGGELATTAGPRRACPVGLERVCRLLA